MPLRDFWCRGIFLAVLCAVVLVGEKRVASLTTNDTSYIDCPGIDTVGNGCCDADNNVPECGYDGGDCCPCTCEEVTTCDGYVGFDCRDPDVECGRDPEGGGASEHDYPECNGTVPLIGDAFCDDEELNNPECGYDGGDCCSCTCVMRDVVEFSCTSVFTCRNPYADCGSSLSSAEFSYRNRGCLVQRIGDGSCDADNNSADCLWDGGDCCSCTCQDGPANACGSSPDDFDCQNPDASCDSVTVWVPAVGAGLGLVAFGVGCRAIYLYGVRKRREIAVGSAAVGAYGVDPNAQRNDQPSGGSGAGASVVAQ